MAECNDTTANAASRPVKPVDKNATLPGGQSAADTEPSISVSETCVLAVPPGNDPSEQVGSSEAAESLSARTSASAQDGDEDDQTIPPGRGEGDGISADEEMMIMNAAASLFAGEPALAQDEDIRGRVTSSESEKLGDGINTNAPSGILKTRQRESIIIGAESVDEQAPDLNRRFYLGLDRPSMRERRASLALSRRLSISTNTPETGTNTAESGSYERLTVDTNDGGTQIPRNVQESEVTPRISLLGEPSCLFGTEETSLIAATLVEEDGGEVVEAKRLAFGARKWKTLAFTLVFFVVLLFGVAVLFLMELMKKDPCEMVPSARPSMQPSPSFDPRPEYSYLEGPDQTPGGQATRRSKLSSTRRHRL